MPKKGGSSAGLPVRMLHDRLLVSLEGEPGERRSGGGKEYLLLRERDLHAIAAERVEDGPSGLYL